MRRTIQRLRDLSHELRRRRVYRAAVLYAACGVALLQGADLMVGAQLLPTWSVPLGVVLVAVGFPVVVALAWAFQFTDKGLKADAPVPPSIGGWIARGVVVTAAVLLSAAAGWFGWALWVRPATPVAGAAVEDAPPDPARIAVLYFDDHSPNRELGYLAAGLTEGLLHELAQVPSLQVVSRNAVKAYRDGDVTLDSLVSSLRIGSLVEGSVSRSGDLMRVTVQLVDAATETHLASRVVERPDGDPLLLEDQLADEVARILRERLGTEIRLREWRRSATSSEAWALMRRASSLHDEYKRLWKGSPEAGIRGMITVDSLLAEAERLDPEWAELVVLRGWVAYDVAQRRGTPDTPDSAWCRQALRHAERAITLRPEDAAGHELRGVVLAVRSGVPGSSVDPDSAEASLRRAIAADPGATRAWSSLANLLHHQDRYEEARHAARNAVQADAFLQDAEEVILTLYESALKAGPEEEARVWCERGRKRFPENANFVLCRLFVLASFPQVEPDVSYAWALLDTLNEVSSAQNREGFRTIGEVAVAAAAARAGLPDSAQAVLRQVHERGAPSWVAYYEAHVRLLIGQEDDAVRLLSGYLETYPDTAGLARDWWFQGLHEHPGFRALIGS